MSESAVYLLDSWLKRTDRGVEWGASRSTLWFASKVEHLTSVENNPEWYEKVRILLHEEGMQNKVDLRFVPVKQQVITDQSVGHPYANVVEEMQDESLDFALVDGKLRVLCMENVIPKIKPGGLLILDNSERYFPTRALGKHTFPLEPRDQYLDQRWERLWGFLGEWRSIVTTSGVSDTRLWVKPL